MGHNQGRLTELMRSDRQEADIRRRRRIETVAVLAGLAAIATFFGLDSKVRTWLSGPAAKHDGAAVEPEGSFSVVPVPAPDPPDERSKKTSDEAERALQSRLAALALPPGVQLKLNFTTSARYDDTFAADASPREVSIAVTGSWVTSAGSQALSFTESDRTGDGAARKVVDRLHQTMPSGK
jgi:hypothetical protein